MTHPGNSVFVWRFYRFNCIRHIISKRTRSQLKKLSFHTANFQLQHFHGVSSNGQGKGHNVETEKCSIGRFAFYAATKLTPILSTSKPAYVGLRETPSKIGFLCQTVWSPGADSPNFRTVSFFPSVVISSSFENHFSPPSVILRISLSIG